MTADDEALRDFTRALFGRATDDSPAADVVAVEVKPRNVVPREGSNPGPGPLSGETLRDFTRALFDTSATQEEWSPLFLLPSER